MPVPIACRCIVAHIHPAAEQKPPHSCFQAIGNGRFPPLLHPCRIWHTDKTRKGRVPYWSGTLPADGRRAGSKSARTMKPRPSETPPTIPCLLSGDTLRSLGFHPPTMIASLQTLDASRQLSGRGQSDDVHPPIVGITGICRILPSAVRIGHANHVGICLHVGFGNPWFSNIFRCVT